MGQKSVSGIIAYKVYINIVKLKLLLNEGEARSFKHPSPCGEGLGVGRKRTLSTLEHYETFKYNSKTLH